MLAGRLIVDDLSVNADDLAAAGSNSAGAQNEMSSIISLSPEARWKSPLQRLLSPDLKMTSLLLWFIWLACAFCYYGMVLMSTELLAGASQAEEEGDCINRNAGTRNSSAQEDCAAGCRTLTTADYTDLLWTTLAEFPGSSS